MIDFELLIGIKRIFLEKKYFFDIKPSGRRNVKKILFLQIFVNNNISIHHSAVFNEIFKRKERIIIQLNLNILKLIDIFFGKLF